MPIIKRKPVEGAAASDARIVDQHIGTAPSGLHCLYRRCKIFIPADIAFEEKGILADRCKFAQDRLPPFLMNIGHAHPIAGSGEAQCQLPAETAGGAGDEDTVEG